MIQSFKCALDEHDNMGQGAFHFACRSGSKELVQFMIDSNHDYVHDLDLEDWSGETPFHIACQSGSKDLVQLMT